MSRLLSVDPDQRQRKKDPSTGTYISDERPIERLAIDWLKIEADQKNNVQDTSEINCV